MKRFVAILLILVLVFALSATAFAASNVTSPEKGNTNPNVNPDSGKTSPQTGEHPVGNPGGRCCGRSGAVLRQKAGLRQVRWHNYDNKAP